MTGRAVDLAREPWLQGPVGDVITIGDTWLDREAARLDAELVREAGVDAGLLPTVSGLDAADFRAESLHPAVRDFYELTSRWRLDAWIGWSVWAWPGGWVIASIFARRLQQLALPLRPLDVAHGMTSQVVPLLSDGKQVAALWLRTLRSTGDVVFSGLYSVCALHVNAAPAVRVCFPLPNGRLVVLLAPRTTSDGGLFLTSGPGRWGEPGTYLVVEDGPSCWAKRVPVHEQFHVFVDDEGVLRTDHRLDFGRQPVLRLHYRMSREQPAISRASGGRDG